MFTVPGSLFAVHSCKTPGRRGPIFGRARLPNGPAMFSKPGDGLKLLIYYANESPSSWCKMRHLLKYEPNLHDVCTIRSGEFGMSWARLRLRLPNPGASRFRESFVGQVGERIGPAHLATALTSPLRIQSDVREPRIATNHQSPLTNHFSPLPLPLAPHQLVRQAAEILQNQVFT